MEKKLKIIKSTIDKTNSINPLEIVQQVMDNQEIEMHGPIHHIIDGASFMKAMKNAGYSFDFDSSFIELVNRGLRMPGATCGQWGVCGSVSSVGSALAIMHQTSPLSSNQYYKDNMFYTSKALYNIAEIGGPRCCKRNAFISITTAIDFVKEKYNVELEKSDVTCHYYPNNKQCLHTNCPYFPKNK